MLRWEIAPEGGADDEGVQAIAKAAPWTKGTASPGALQQGIDAPTRG